MHSLLFRLDREPSRAGRRLRVPGLVLLAVAASVAAPARSPAQSCPQSVGGNNSIKPNKLYLYFPTADDYSFPPYATQTRPAKRFDTLLLPSYTGSAADLRNEILEVVADGYCEFNVEVLSTTTPPPKVGRIATVAIGTDSRPFTFGQADAVDAGNARPVDFARVWAGWYQSKAGGTGGALYGQNSTLDRWATSIGGTAAHEAGHLYGLSHHHGALVKRGEDALTRHLMPSGALLTDEQRAAYRRHFSDTDFSFLAANVGLSIQSMHNWELVNPNPKAATRLRIDFLSPRPSVVVAGANTGPRTPWNKPSVTALNTTKVIGRKTHYAFQLTWSAPKPWGAGGNSIPGQVPPGGQFYVGVTFPNVSNGAPDPILVTGITLVDASGKDLPLAPRIPAYDAGTLDAKDGSFDVGFFDLEGGAGQLVLAGVEVYALPRPLFIDAMLPGEPLRSWTGEPIEPWPLRDSVPPLAGSRPIPRMGSAPDSSLLVPIARLAGGRNLFQNVVTSNCSAPADRSSGDELNECVNGIFVDLFPATTVYMIATIVEPQAQHWDPAQGQMVVGPVQSRIFYQFAGLRPDLNQNGRDDAIDIFRGTSQDLNRDGVPDDALGMPRRFPWWWFLLLAGAAAIQAA